MDMQTLTPRPYKILSIHEQIEDYVRKHITPFVFGYGPDPNNYNFNSGTATLMDLGRGPFALTCEHVVTAFREFREINTEKVNAQLYIGRATGIDRKVIDWNENLDIATLQLIKDELNAIHSNQTICGTQYINQVYTGPIKEEDVIAFGGFPSEPTWRYKNNTNNLFAFHSCVCFAEVVSINNDYIICQSNFIIYKSETSHEITLHDDPTGMSGGAAFLIRQKGINVSCHFIGIVSSGKFLTQNCLTTYIMLAKQLNRDGTIKEAVA